MKHFFSRLLPAVMGIMLLSSVTAFAQPNADAKEAYDKLMAKSQAMADSNMYCHMDMVVSDGKENVNMAMDMSMLMKNMNQPENLQYMLQAVMSAEGIQQSVNMFYRDGYSYIESDGMKMKTKMPMTEAIKSAMDASNALNATADFIADMSLTTEGENRILSYSLDAAKMNAYLTQTLQQMGLGSLLSEMSIKMQDIKGTYVLTPDDYYSDATISMGMTMTMGEDTIYMVIAGQVKMLNPGQPVEIAFPDLSEFKEATAEDIAA